MLVFGSQVIAAALLGFSAAAVAASEPDALTTASPLARSSFFPPAITAADVNEAVSNSLKDVTGMYIYAGQREIKILSPLSAAAVYLACCGAE